MEYTICRDIKKIINNLKKQGISLLEEENPLILNKLSSILTKKNILPIDIANLIGVSRQTINSILNSNTKPNIEIALKISYVLNIPVEDIFVLNKKYWFNNDINKEKDTSYFLNIITGEIVNSSQKKKFIKKNKAEYYNIVEKKCLTKEQRDSILKEYIGSKEDFNQKYIKIFIKLVKKFKPITIGDD